MVRKMDKKDIESIKNYSKEIITLDDFVEVVRKMPGMYIGPIGDKGFLNMIREIFQNSVDQMVRKNGIANRVILSYDERTHMVIVEDNGFGIPFADMIRIFTEQHTGSNFVKKDGEFSSGRHGIGSKVTNALCDSYIVESYILGEARKMEFKDGKPTTKKPIVIPNPDNKQGTITTFVPYEGLGQLTLPYQVVLDLVRTITSLTNIGNVVEFNSIDINGKEYHETIINEDGIMSNLYYKTTNPLIMPILISNEIGDKKADIVFTYDATTMDEEDITAFANFCPTIAGTHVEGFIDGVTKFFRGYMNNVYLNKNSKLKVVNNDIRTGLKAMVAVSHKEPIFVGQSKDQLSNDDMKPYVRDIIYNGLEEWAKNNPNDLQKVAKFLKEMAEIRTKSEEGKAKLSTKYASSSITGLPSQYLKPNGTKNLEFIITEGESAKSSARKARCNARQGIFPIKGKLPNAFTTSKKDYLSNDEISAIINIIGAGYGKTFELQKMKFEKVIIACDADDDGAHIHTLALGFFVLYMPEVILSGRLYKAVPPLYGVKKGKNTAYFTDRLSYVSHIQKEFSKNNNITTVGGNKLTTNEVTTLLYNNMYYNYDLEILASTFALNPELLELALINLNKPFKELKKIIEKAFRFMEVKQVDGQILMEGLVDSKSQTLLLNDKMLYNAKNVLNYINKVNESMYYKVNGEIVSIHNIMNLFGLSQKNSVITRYKGLGEMNPDQLRDSTLHPDSGRTLIQYTLEDAKKEIELMRSLQSSKGRADLINSVKVSREELLG